MGSNENNNQDRSGSVLYVYCIAEAGPANEMLSESSPPAIEDGAAVELIDAGNLAAIVSSVPSTSYDEMSLAEHLTDPSWTALRAMRHENVVEHFAKRTSVVPLRFGTIYLERARIETMLSDNNLRLAALLERLRNREEWGVNVYLDKNLLMATITSLSPRLKDLTERAANASPGESYLLKKRIETMKADEARIETNRAIAEIEKELGAKSVDARRLRVLKVEGTEHGELKAKFAFLIQRSEFQNFQSAAEKIARKLKSGGISLELTGPWPAYNFAGDE
ncbi:MAG TPA: GvpL/GvpF family gas vesicle protein [Pyrinomonadaceae bacterium]|nr:GvpL/GvpF family gas vesicle protein [Pyrinomonadaceae bacterium]